MDDPLRDRLRLFTRWTIPLKFLDLMMLFLNLA